MTEPNVHNTDSQILSRLWQCDTDALATWQPDELASIFEHLLAAPLVDELGTIDPQLAEELRQLETTPRVELESFGDLLQHEQPPLDLLKLVKDYCKRSDGDESLPSDVAFVLYAAVISAALVRRDKRITSADDRSLRSKIKWAASRNWIDAATRGLFEKALTRLR
jgi:hypothetical protein